jgi:hypothetical protein
MILRKAWLNGSIAGQTQLRCDLLKFTPSDRFIGHV